MRHGAEVVPVMSRAAAKLIHPDLMFWATGNSPVVELTGALEHVALGGNVEDSCDLILIAPATANTIGKIACGIDDTAVTTTVTTAIGEGLPVVVVPAMHEPMYNHPIVKENLERLSNHGLRLVMPSIAEGKAKIAPVDTIVQSVIATLRRPKGEGALAGKRLIVTAGRTVEYIDDIRCITNNSSGKMGMAVAEAALEADGDVTVVFGRGTANPPAKARVERVDTAEEMQLIVNSLVRDEKFDVCIATAAVGDWKPLHRPSGKISTHGVESITLELVPTPKIIDGIKDIDPDIFLVAFRALSNLDKDELIGNAFERLKSARADLIAVNDTARPGVGFESETNELYVVDKNKEVLHIPKGSKSEVGRLLVERISRDLEARNKG